MICAFRSYQPDDEEAVVALWEACGLTVPWNDPRKDIARKLTVQKELFLVGFFEEQLVAAGMAGYDGHRGTIYYLGVHPDFQKQGIGAQLMREVEERLTAMGCPKMNLLVRDNNTDVIKFYESIGYEKNPVVCFGKRLIPDG